MISFNYETEFELQNESDFSKWLSAVILSENKKEGEINYIFCDDDYLLEINQAMKTVKTEKMEKEMQAKLWKFIKSKNNFAKH